MTPDMRKYLNAVADAPEDAVGFLAARGSA